MARIPATVITGFLGAGKTSLVRHMIETIKDKRIALIINEFGDVGVDGDILRGCGDAACKEDDIVELANGCLCCTVADDFVPTIEALLDRPNPPEHIIIETSGLALPKPLVKAFNWPSVRANVTVDGVVAVVDTPAVASGMFAHDHHALEAQRAEDDALDHESPLDELFEEQLQCADLIVLNKCDAVSATQIADAKHQVEHHKRPAANIIQVSNSQADPALLLGLGMAAEDDLDSRPSHHDGMDEHEHDDFDSFVLNLGVVTDVNALLDRLSAAVNNHPIYRVKGYVAVKGADARLLIQGVGDRFDKAFDRDWFDDEVRQTRLVVIGEHDFDQAAISAVIAG